MTKCLAIAPQPFFSARGTPLSVYYRTMVTAANNVKIDLLTYGHGLDTDIPGLRIIRIPQFKAFGNVPVGPSILKAWLDIFMLVWTVCLLIRYKYDYVHAHEEAIFFCRFLKPIFGFKLVYDMHSSLPQQLTNFKFTKSRILIGLFQTLEDSSLQAADVVITICPALADYVESRIEDTDKHLLIENSIFEPVKLIAEGSDELKSGRSSFDDSDKQFVNIPPEKKYVVYAGTLEPYQGIEILIEAFRKVTGVFSDTALIIVGGNKDQVGCYSTFAQKNGLNGHVHFTGHVSQAFAQKYCRLASVLVSPRIEGSNTPLKIYEQLASGIPLVATSIYSHTQVLNDDVAFLVKPDSVDMAQGIQLALGSKNRAQRIATNAKKLYETKYSRAIYDEKIRRMLSLIL